MLACVLETRRTKQCSRKLLKNLKFSVDIMNRVQCGLRLRWEEAETCLDKSTDLLRRSKVCTGNPLCLLALGIRLLAMTWDQGVLQGMWWSTHRMGLEFWGLRLVLCDCFPWEDVIDDHDCSSYWKSPKQGDLSNQCPRDKCSYQDLGISQKTAICLQGRKSHDILYVKIDYFINRLIEIQAVSSLPGYISQP